MKPPTPWPRDPLPRAALPDVTPFGYTGNRLHPTQQPVAAMRTVLEAYTQPSQLVLDPFCGSGSTLEPPRRVDAIGVAVSWTHGLRRWRAEDWPRKRPFFLIYAFTVLRVYDDVRRAVAWALH